VRQCRDPSVYSDAERCACGDQFVAYSIDVAYSLTIA
jgi:hypothetical protein